MALFYSEYWAFVFGVIGNVISCMTFLAPLPTFYRIYKKKSTEGFQSVPYVTALLSAMLWIYYAHVKNKATLLLLTINIYGFGIEAIYIIIFLLYASNKARLSTIKLLFLTVCGYGTMVILTTYLTKGSKRLSIIGWICMVFNICVFASPLFILKQVIKTKSVAFMPLNLSFFLTLNAIVWFFYGLLIDDFYIAIPNTLGFVFGIVQMVIYLIYKGAIPLESTKLQKPNDHVLNICEDVPNGALQPDPNQVVKSGAPAVAVIGDEDPNNGK